MSWLKTAEPDFWHAQVREAIRLMEIAEEKLYSAGFEDESEELRELVVKSKAKLAEETKEGSVYNDVEYQAQDLNVGDSGCFEEEHVHDGKPTTEVNPGPASTVPGSNATNSPQIPGQDGALQP